ncbi:MAG: TIGR01244 family sulfur transferase [Colwellia sp.]|nr:TIGR01244 family sulfur transferase [Colwellia sp.]
MKLQKLSQDIYIADQIDLSDLEQFNRLGIKTIINNRPDQEINAPRSAEVAQRTKELGLSYHYLPIIPGEYLVENISALTAIVAALSSPMVAYCRTGNRSTTLWGLSQQKILGMEEVIKKAKHIGFNIEKTL